MQPPLQHFLQLACGCAHSAWRQSEAKLAAQRAIALDPTLTIHARSLSPNTLDFSARPPCPPRQVPSRATKSGSNSFPWRSLSQFPGAARTWLKRPLNPCRFRTGPSKFQQIDSRLWPRLDMRAGKLLAREGGVPVTGASVKRFSVFLLPSRRCLASFRCMFGLILLLAEGAVAMVLLGLVGALALSFFGARAVFHPGTVKS